MSESAKDLLGSDEIRKGLKGLSECYDSCKLKETLAEYFKVWLIQQYPAEFDQYKESLEYNIIDLSDAMNEFPLDRSKEYIFAAYMTPTTYNMYKLPSKEKSLEMLEKDEQKEAWKHIIAVVYDNLASIETHRTKLLAEFRILRQDF